ncbi:hypothetical protein CEE44_01495 [Candidatus Woesearchaeota archaeon B3_Woes]|nr:MAG: hypothetical protein CEE44_01495 [Candidatus Woesearchaeota archaeon B3_Woes]
MTNLIKNKKGVELTQQLVITILFIIFIFALVVFVIKAGNMIQEKTRQLIKADLEADIRSGIDFLSSKYGNIKKYTFYLPEVVDTACFVDLNKSSVIIYNTTLVRDYPMINESLSAGNNKNLFFIDDFNVVEELYVGNVCFDYYPFYSCLSTPNNVLDVWFEGRAGCTTIYFNWSMFPTNNRDFSLYSDNPLFLIQEKNESGDVKNWREILEIVSLTLFKENQTIYIYNYSVAYKNDIYGDINSSDMVFLMDNYSTNKTYLFNSTYSGGSPSGYTIETKSTKTSDYFDYWINYSSLILVDYDNEYAGLVGTLLASYVNTPLIFIDDNNGGDYEELIRDKEIFIVTYGSIILDDNIYQFVRDYSTRYQLIPESFLRSEGSISNFIKLYSRAVIVDLVS